MGPPTPRTATRRNATRASVPRGCRFEREPVRLPQRLSHPRLLGDPEPRRGRGPALPGGRSGSAEAYIRPQRRYADIVVSFMPGDRGDQEHLDARVAMRPGLLHPDLTPLVDGGANGITLQSRASETTLWVSGTIGRDHADAIH